MTRLSLHIVTAVLGCMILAGCVGYTVTVSGSTLHASLMGMDVADVTLPEDYTYSKTKKIWLGDNQSVPCQMRFFVSDTATFGFCAILVEPNSVVFPEKQQVESTPFLYNPAVGTNALPPQPGKLPAGYRIRAFTRLAPEQSIILRSVNAHKDGHYLLATYFETLKPDDPCLKLPSKQKDFTEDQQQLLSRFEARAERALAGVSLH